MVPVLVFRILLQELTHPPSPALAVIEDIHWVDAATLDLHPLRIVLGHLASASNVCHTALPRLSLAPPDHHGRLAARKTASEATVGPCRLV